MATAMRYALMKGSWEMLCHVSGSVTFRKIWFRLLSTTVSRLRWLQMLMEGNGTVAGTMSIVTCGRDVAIASFSKSVRSLSDVPSLRG